MSLTADILIVGSDGNLSDQINIPPQTARKAILTVRNNTASDIWMQGANIWSDLSYLTVGNIPAFTAQVYQTQSAGTPVTASYPNPQAPNSQIITYYPYNISGSVTSEKLYYRGTQYIPANTTVVFDFGVYNSLSFQEYLNLGTIGGQGDPAKVQAVVNYTSVPSFDTPVPVAPQSTIVAASASAYNTIDPQAFFLSTTTPSLVVLDTFQKPPQYKEFDTIVNGTFDFGNGTILQIAPEFISDFTSSDTGIATVVQNGAFSATTQSSTTYPYSADADTLIIGGGGAVKFTGAEGSVTIEDRLFPGVTGSISFTVVKSAPVKMAIVPSLTNTYSGSAGLPKADLKAYGYTTDGKIQDITTAVTWTSNNPSIATVANGVVTAVNNLPNSVTISAKVEFNGTQLYSSAQVNIVKQY